MSTSGNKGAKVLVSPGSERPSTSSKPRVVKYSEGVSENAYREVIHASAKKIEKIKKLLGSGRDDGYEINIEVCILLT